LVAVFLFGMGMLSAGTAEALVHHTAKTSADPQIVQALQSAHQVLAGANHDYKGHRVLAMHQIRLALKQLGHTPAASATKKAHPAKKAAHSAKLAVHEDQAKSDAQLKQAQQILQGISGLSNAKAAHVSAAIAEINTALSIR
jgi:hypothetical protein